MRVHTFAVFLIISFFAGKAHVVITDSVNSSLSKISTTLSSVGKNVQSKVNNISGYLKSEKGAERVNTISSSIVTMSVAVQGLASSDVESIVASSMVMLSAVAPLIPVAGPIVSAVFGLIGSIFGAMGGTQDIGSIVREIIEEALNNYDDSELRAETTGTMRVYRISQAYLNSVGDKIMNEHEVAALASNVPVHSGVKFLGVLSQKIKEYSQKYEKTQVLRAAEYIQLYVTLSVMKNSILWQMYSVVREAPNSDWTAAAIKRVVIAEQYHGREFLQFLTQPVYTKAVFFSYFNISKWPVTKQIMSKYGLMFGRYLGSRQYSLFIKENNEIYFLAFEAGYVVATRNYYPNIEFYFDIISAENNIYYIRSVKYTNQYIYMPGSAEIYRGGKPDNKGKFKLIRFDDGKYMLSTIESPEKFLCAPGLPYVSGVKLRGEADHMSLGHLLKHSL